jgi:hypothetical protein
VQQAHLDKETPVELVIQQEVLQAIMALAAVVKIQQELAQLQLNQVEVAKVFLAL